MIVSNFSWLKFPTLKAWSLKEDPLFFHFFPWHLGLPGFSISDDKRLVAVNTKCAREKCKRRKHATKNIGPSEAAPRVSGFVGFLLETPLKRGPPFRPWICRKKGSRPFGRISGDAKHPWDCWRGIKNPPSVRTWNLWFLGGGFNKHLTHICSDWLSRFRFKVVGDCWF